MDPPKVNVPPMKDLTIDNITENTVLINSQSEDRRLTYVMERLVTHLHDFARETRLSTKVCLKKREIDEKKRGVRMLEEEERGWRCYKEDKC